MIINWKFYWQDFGTSVIEWSQETNGVPSRTDKLKIEININTFLVRQNCKKSIYEGHLDT